MAPKKTIDKVLDKSKGKGKSKDVPSDTKGGAGKLKAATSINVRHILCEKHSKKEEALSKLREGSKFDDVAREFSEDKARQGEVKRIRFNIIIAELLLSGVGGSLGWKVRGSLNGDFEKAAYELEPSTTGSPKYVEVKTVFGYHIIMIEGRR